MRAGSLTARGALGPLALGAIALAAMAPRPAAAHEVVESSSPRQGSTVRALPATITIRFSEPPLEATSARLIRDGRDYAGRMRIDARDARVVRITTRRRPKGASASTPAPARTRLTGKYRLVWRIIAADGHAQAGAIVFRVGRPAS